MSCVRYFFFKNHVMLFKWNRETNKYDQIDLPEDVCDDEGDFHSFGNVMVVG